MVHPYHAEALLKDQGPFHPNVQEANHLDMLPLIVKNANMGNFTTRSMVTMIVIGVFGCFRIGEICGRKEGKDHSFIRNRDLILSNEGIQITLWKTKTDKGNIGVNKFIANLSGCCINPHNLVKSLQIARRVALKPDDPFFATPNGKPISRDLLVKFIQGQMKDISRTSPANIGMAFHSEKEVQLLP